MAAQVAPLRRPKLSLQINTSPVQSIFPQAKPVQSIHTLPAITPVRRIPHFSYGNNSDSEEDAKFWSGEEASSATSSEDEEPMRKVDSMLAVDGNTVLLPSPSCLTSPFLPPPTGMKFPTPTQRPGMKKLRLFTALPPTVNMSSPMSAGPQPKQKLSLAIPPEARPLPPRIGILPSPPFSPHDATAATKLPQKASTKPRKSVSFSAEPDTVISTTNYTLSNADLLEYFSSEECSAEELSEKWGMTVEEGRMLGMPRSRVDRRERKWIGLTNSFLRDGRKKFIDSDEEEEEEE